MAILALSVIGMWGVVPIAVQQLTGVAPCPHLGPLPACYVVFLGYGLTAISALLRGKPQRWVFFAGVTPLLGLAVFASSMQALGFSACPLSANSVPLCFYSLALALLLVAAYSQVGLMPDSQQKV